MSQPPPHTRRKAGSGPRTPRAPLGVERVKGGGALEREGGEHGGHEAVSESGDGGGNGARGRGERVKAEGMKGPELRAREAGVKDRGARAERGEGTR